MTDNNQLPEDIKIPNNVVQEIVDASDDPPNAPYEYSNTEAACFECGWSAGYQVASWKWYKQLQSRIADLEAKISESVQREVAYRGALEEIGKTLVEYQLLGSAKKIEKVLEKYNYK